MRGGARLTTGCFPSWLKKARKGSTIKAESTDQNTEELQEEISRLKSQNTDLRIKLQQYCRDVDSLREETNELAKRWVNKDCVLQDDEESNVSSVARISSSEDNESTDNETALISSDEDVLLSSLTESSDLDEERISRPETALERLRAETKGSNEKIKHKTSRLTKPKYSSTMFYLMGGSSMIVNLILQKPSHMDL
ncbi:hypothetical protein P5673_025758, partial [Acropora cervicornis]